MCKWLILLLLITSACWADSRQAACWTDGAAWVAALDDGQVRLGRVTPDEIEDMGAVPAAGVSALATGVWAGKPVLLGSRGKELLRFDANTKAWSVIGSVKAPIRQILPARDRQPAAVILTGGAGEVPKDGAVWWATWGKAFTCTRVAAVKDTYRPWQVWWSANAGEERLAVATFKSTQYAPFEHNCMFLFTWKNGAAEPCWLGSRLTRPYLEAAHADLRGDGRWRIAAVEVTKDGGRGLSVYEPAQFGYANEWKTEAIPGLQHIAACDDLILCSGSDAAGNTVAWQLLPDGDGYRLAALPEAPPSLDALARIDATRLAGWWNGAWHVITLTTK